MIITKLMGGLGNQMFQYAIGRSLSIESKTTLKLDKSFFDRDTIPKRHYGLDIFNISPEFASTSEINNMRPLKNFIVSKSPKLQKFLAERTKTYVNEYYTHGLLPAFDKDLYLEGNWQSEDYFKKNSTIIKKDFTFKRELGKKSSDWLKKIDTTNSISVHFRRTDYVNRPKGNEIVGCSLDYYSKAFALMEKKVSDPIFFVFSDDLDWVKRNINSGGKSVNYLSFSEAEDLHLMTKCRHNILANSSFSWWGAWLNSNPNKIVIAPDPWLENSPNKYHSYVPKNWITLPKV